MKLSKVLLTALLLVPFTAAQARLPDINATAWALVDGNSGLLLAQSNAAARLPVAGLNKLMTANVVLEHIASGVLEADKIIAVNNKAVPGNRLFLKNDEYAEVETLLQGMAIHSANDAAVVLAQHVAKTEPGFAALMNSHASDIGMTDSKFSDATGLEDGQYSSAHDMAILARHLVHKHSNFYASFRLKQFVYRDLEFFNSNALLWRNSSVDGLMSSRNKKAGFCTVVSAVRDGMRLIVTVLGARSESAGINAADTLLDHGYDNYESRLIYEGNRVITTIPLWMGSRDSLQVGIADNLYVTLAHGQHTQTRAELVVNKAVQAPVEKGQVVGTLLLKLDDNILARTPLIALEKAGTGNIFNRISDTVQLWFQ